MTSTAALLAFAAGDHVLPSAVRSDSIRLLRDTLGVGWAGSGVPAASAAFAAAARWGRGGSCRILGRDERLPAPAAAFVNGFHIHCLEWDAVHEPAVVHAMSVVTAALFGVIDRRGDVAVDDALTALAVGVDVACGLGISAKSDLRFFRPATAGLIGAALACGRIEGIPAVRFADLLGLAYSQCAGTMQAHVEGSVALPLQIANAARAAVTAVDLTAQGLGGPHDALEGPFGYFRLFDEGTLDDYVRSLGTVWRISEISTKPYPSGRASHGTLGAIEQLQAETSFGPDDVAAIEVRAPPLIHRLVGRRWQGDMNAPTARLCLPFLAALMIADRRIDPRRFEPGTFANSALQALGDKLALVADGTTDPNALFPQSVTITLVDGRKLTLAVPATRGSPDNPLSPAAADAKWRLCRELGPGTLPILLERDPERYFAGTDA